MIASTDIPTIARTARKELGGDGAGRWNWGMKWLRSGAKGEGAIEMAERATGEGAADAERLRLRGVKHSAWGARLIHRLMPHLMHRL